MHKHVNRLIDESSPYLVQHAHNPVDWFPWGEEAINRAKRENKPILVSIGYAACHWCHVMERESFEDEATAAFMNENFVNIKIDREERPDLDHIYMDAVQSMTGSGGWPLNVFLTPDKKPFYGGTYFPPKRAFNRASWMETLQSVAMAFRERRPEIDKQAEGLSSHLLTANSFGLRHSEQPDKLLFGKSLKDMYENLMKSADREWGGFGRAPKFPQTFCIQFLLRYYDHFGEHAALDHALLSLDKMIDGGIYDQLGGGFARYSTDTEWLAPHFEKMLYDNALLVIVLSEAYQLTGKKRYREVIAETMKFVQRELMHPQKGFFSALDADSEGEEGKYYVWSEREVLDLLGPDGAVFCRYYDISNQGNWEGENILRVKLPVGDFALKYGISAERLEKILVEGKEILFRHREKRVRPLLDDKVILSWNSLMNVACSKAFAATGEDSYRELAIDNMQFLLKAFKGEPSANYNHTWKNGQARYPAFLDDYALLIQALINLQETTGDTTWLAKAATLAETVITEFADDETGFFFYTNIHQTDVIIRKKEVYDGALPSGNAVMGSVLNQLAVLYDRNGWRQQAVEMMSALGQAIVRYPTSFGYWACLFFELTTGTVEIAITGKQPEKVHRELLSRFIPGHVLMATSEPEKPFPLLREKAVGDETFIYVCKDFSCLLPVTSAEEALEQIKASKRRN